MVLGKISSRIQFRSFDTVSNLRHGCENDYDYRAHGSHVIVTTLTWTWFTRARFRLCIFSKIWTVLSLSDWHWIRASAFTYSQPLTAFGLALRPASPFRVTTINIWKQLEIPMSKWGIILDSLTRTTVSGSTLLERYCHEPQDWEVGWPVSTLAPSFASGLICLMPSCTFVVQRANS